MFVNNITPLFLSILGMLCEQKSKGAHTMKTYIIGGSKVTIIPPQITDSERDARLKQIEETIRALLISLYQKEETA